MYDGMSDTFDYLLHYRQLMTLDIGNDILLYKVFLSNFHGSTLSQFHQFPHNSINSFRDETFVGHYLCSACQKQNISTLQNIKMQKNELLRDFMKRFGQIVLQVESYSMDAILQIFKWSISLGTPFFESLTKNMLISMDDLFRWTDKYAMLEDNVRATSQQVLVMNWPTKNNKVGSSKPPNNQFRQGGQK